MYIKRPINKPRWFGLTGSGGGDIPEPPPAPAPNGERIIYGCGLEGTSIDFNPDDHGEGVYIVYPSMSSTPRLYGNVSAYWVYEVYGGSNPVRYGGTRGIYFRDFYVSDALLPPDEREETHIRGRFFAEDTLKMVTDVPKIGARRKLKEGQYLICPQCVMWNHAFTPINLDSGEPNSRQFSSSPTYPYLSIRKRRYDGDNKYLKVELDGQFVLGHTVNIENYEVIGDIPTDYMIGVIFNIRPLQYVSKKGLEFVNPQRFLNYDLTVYAVNDWHPKNIIVPTWKPGGSNISSFGLRLNFPQRNMVGERKVTILATANKNGTLTGVYKLVKGVRPISLEEAKPFIEGGTIVETTGYLNTDGSVRTGIPIGYYATLCFGGG